MAGTCSASFIVQLEEMALYSVFEKCQSYQSQEVPPASEVGLAVEVVIAEFGVGC